MPLSWPPRTSGGGSAVANRFRTVEATIAGELAKPYVYGESDCFFLGCRMADALDPSLGLVDRYWRSYSTLSGAQRALRRRMCKSLVELFERHLDPIAPAMARIGDIAVLDLAGAEHVAICLGARFITRTEHGRSFHGVAECAAAFRAG